MAAVMPGASKMPNELDFLIRCGPSRLQQTTGLICPGKFLSAPTAICVFWCRLVVLLIKGEVDFVRYFHPETGAYAYSELEADAIGFTDIGYVADGNAWSV